jgi:hypothetical protein
LFLLLVLLAAWIGNLHAGTFLTASPTGNPTFGQEIFPIAARMRAAIQEKLESLPPALPNLLTAASPGDVSAPIPAALPEPPQVLSSAERCYRLMSLQE